MRRLFTVFALVAVLAPPVFASPPDDDPPDTASVAPAADVEIAPIVTGTPGVELVEAFAPTYPEPIGRVIERAHRIDVPPPNVIRLGTGSQRSVEVRRVGNGESRWRLTSVG